MKKISTLIMALALALGMSQCKKNVEPVSPNPDTATPIHYGKAVHITVGVIKDKHEVNTGTGEVNYTNNDVIYVGNNGKYIGTLTYSYGVFSGTIYDPVETDYLHFYFVGGLDPGTLTVGETTSFDVNISDQSSVFPVLSYGKSNVMYKETTTSYLCTLLNKCALVKFNLVESSNQTVYVDDMKTTATINFADPYNAIVAGNTTGEIALQAKSGTEKWAILLLQSRVDGAGVRIGDDEYSVDVPTITANAHITSGIEIDNRYVWKYHGFEVGTNSYVDFSSGNLQYKPSVGFRFAPIEYEYYEDFINDEGWYSLFNWGGWTGNPAQDPQSTNNDEPFTMLDNGGLANDPTGNGYTWRLLTRDEADHLLNYNQHGKTHIEVNNKSYYGMVLRPHGLNKAVEASYTPETWAIEQAEGSIFLPAAGFCLHTDISSGTPVYDEMQGVGTNAKYWTSTSNGYTSGYIIEDQVGTGLDPYLSLDYEGWRLSVRLVRNR